MTKYTLIFLLSLACCSRINAQTKFITHDPFHHPFDDDYPNFDGHFVWWNDSTVTYVSFYDKDSIRTLYKRVDFLMRDDLETHRRLDSLIGEMREGHVFKPGMSVSTDTIGDDFWFYFRHQLAWLSGGGEIIGNILDRIPADYLKSLTPKKTFDSLVVDFYRPYHLITQ